MRRLACLILLGLAGCAGVPRLDLPPEPVAVGGVVPAARLHSEVVVRAFQEDAEGRRQEVGGADCLLATEAYSARFRSPGRVLVPVWSGAPPLEVTCRARERDGTVRQRLVSRWADPYPPGWGPWRDPFWPSGSGAWVSVSFGGPVWHGRGWSGRRLVYYPDIRVVMR